jgi:hypothetical protein
MEEKIDADTFLEFYVQYYVYDRYASHRLFFLHSDAEAEAFSLALGDRDHGQYYFNLFSPKTCYVDFARRYSESGGYRSRYCQYVHSTFVGYDNHRLLL